jgi:Family of unknown function (DUF5681)
MELATEPDNRALAGSSVVVGARRDFATRFRPGQSGNPHGRPRTAKFRRELVKQLRETVAGTDVTRLAQVCHGMIEKASSDVPAAVFVRDTVDGKPGANETGAIAQISIAIENIGTVTK